MRSVPQEAELRLSVLSDWDTDYKRKLEQSYIVHCCIIFINPTKLVLMKILSPFSSSWKTPEISLPCWIIRLKKEKAYLTKCLFTIFKIHQFSVHLMWNQKRNYINESIVSLTWESMLDILIPSSHQEITAGGLEPCEVHVTVLLSSAVSGSWGQGDQ